MIETPEIVTVSAACTCGAYDNLQRAMREVFYLLKQRPTHILASRAPLTAYEALSLQHDPVVTTFKGVPVLLDDELASSEMHFMRNGVVIGRLRHIS